MQIDTAYQCVRTDLSGLLNMSALTNALCVVQILNDSEARFNSADLNIAYKMDVEEYKRLCPYSQSLEANWGKAPGMSHTEWAQKLP